MLTFRILVSLSLYKSILINLRNLKRLINLVNNTKKLTNIILSTNSRQIEVLPNHALIATAIDISILRIKFVTIYIFKKLSLRLLRVTSSHFLRLIN